MAELPRANRYIANAWERAKKRDPKLSQRKWAAQVMPPTPDPEARRGKRARTPAEAGSLLRRILRGDVDATPLLEESKAAIFLNLQVVDETGTTTGWQNVMKEAGPSTFDLDRIMASSRMDQIIKQEAAVRHQQYKITPKGKEHAEAGRVLGSVSIFGGRY